MPARCYARLLLHCTAALEAAAADVGVLSPDDFRGLGRRDPGERFSDLHERR